MVSIYNPLDGYTYSFNNYVFVILVIASLLAIYLFLSFLRYHFFPSEKQIKLTQENKAKKEKIKTAYDKAVLDVEKFIQINSGDSPRATKFPEASLMKHSILKALVKRELSTNEEEKLFYSEIVKILLKRFEINPPVNYFGKVKFKITDKQFQNYLQKEKKEKIVKINKKTENIIYLASKNGKYYVGQTQRALEERMIEHYKSRSGPFKNCLSPVESWTVLASGVNQKKLDYYESYYIGFYNSYSEGFNSTCGNSQVGYTEGLDSKN